MRGTLVLAFLAVALTAMAVGAQTDPPSSGDWTVSDTTTVSDQVVDLRGNLTVASGGHLTLSNVTLRVHSTLSEDRGISVLGGGRLNITDGDGRNATLDDRSVVMRGVPSLPYFFLTEPGATLGIERSLVVGAGVPGAQEGLLVRSNDTQLMYSTFVDGHGYCVRLEDCHSATVHHCTFERSDGDGLQLRNASLADLYGLEMYENDRTGLVVEGSRDLVVRLVSVRNNTIAGMAVDGSSNISMSNCTVLNNTRGLTVRDTASLWVLDSVVERTSLEGITLSGECSNLSLAHLRLLHAGRTGILGEGVANLTMESCTVSHCTYYGVRLTDGARNVSLGGSRFQWNGYDGVHLERGDGLQVTGCEFSSNGYNGLFVIDFANVSLATSTFDGNGYDGVSMDDIEGLVLGGCTAELNGYDGINLAAGTRGTLVTGCTLANNTRSGLCVDSATDVALVECTLLGNARAGLKVEAQASWVNLTDCTVANNTDQGILVRSSTGVHVDGGSVKAHSGGDAVRAEVGGDALLTNVTLSGFVTAGSGGEVTVVSPSGWNNATEVAGQGSWVDLAYWLQVHVQDVGGAAVPDANVSATSSDGAREVLGLTDATGTTPHMAVTAVSWLPGGSVDRNPVQVRATKGPETAGVSIDLDGNKRITLVLKDDVPPVAVAPDVTVEVGVVAVLEGNGSYDNGRVARWVWTFEDGVGTIQLEGERVEWTFPRIGVHVGVLNVTDLAGLWNVTSFTVTVVDTTLPDVAANGNDTVPQHTSVLLNATGTSDNDPTLMATGEFRWTVAREGDEANSTDPPRGPLSSWTFHEMGLFSVRLLVMDQSGNQAEHWFWVTVLDTTAPTVSAGEDLEVDQGTEVSLSAARLSDNDPGFGGTGHVWWSVEWGDLSENLSGPEATFTPEVMGEYTVTLNALDAAGNLASDSVTLVALDALAPVLRYSANNTVSVGDVVVLDASDSYDNDPLFPLGGLFRWTVSGPELDASLMGANATFVAPWVGEYAVSLEVIDAAGNVATAGFAVTSVDLVGPWFEDFSPGPDVVNPHTRVECSVVARDVGTGLDGASLEYRLSLGPSSEWGGWTMLPAVVDGTSAQVTFVADLAEGENRVQLRCLDGAGNGPVETVTHAVRVNARPSLRVLSPPDDATYGPHDAVTLDASGSSDPDGEELSFTWSSSIDGLLGLGERTTVNGLSPGDHVISVVVTDGITGHEVTASVNVTVRPAPSTVDGEGPLWPWVLLVIVLLLAIVALGLELRSRMAPPPEEEGAG